MGERDPGLAPPKAPPPWRQRAVLAAALAALLGAFLVLGPAVPPGDAGPRALVARLLEAPLTALAGDRGGGVLGVLMLALAAACACRSLERRLGAAAPVLVTLLVFGSGCWALVWTAGVALVPLALAVAAFALAYGGGGAEEAPAEIYAAPEARWRGAIRWLVVGALIAELVPSGPLLAGLLLPAALAVPSGRRRGLLPALLAGFALALGVELAVQGPELLIAPLALAADSFRLDPPLAGRGLLHLALGRNVGLVAGFAPVLLLLALGRGSAARPELAATGLVVAALGALLLPFDFAGGWLNLSFLAVYGALWHLPYRAPRPWQWGGVALLGALALWPVWASPSGALAEGGVRLTGSWPRRHLPYEATLRRLPNRGEGRLAAEDLWVRAVDGCRFERDAGRFELVGAGPATIWIAAPEETGLVALELGPGAPSSFEASGATAGRTVFRPDGRVGFEVLLSEPRGRHRLWFGDRQSTVHLVEVRLPGWQGDRPLRFRLLAKPQP